MNHHAGMILHMLATTTPREDVENYLYKVVIMVTQEPLILLLIFTSIIFFPGI